MASMVKRAKKCAMMDFVLGSQEHFPTDVAIVFQRNQYRDVLVLI